jgi:hypothetical protein
LLEKLRDVEAALEMNGWLRRPDPTTVTPPDRPKWFVGQRVMRTKPEAIGTVGEVDGRLKVKWDSGATSYYTLIEARNIQAVDPESNGKDPKLQ